MMNKKLVFCSFFALFQIVGVSNADAVDTIRPEDEDILWEVNGGGDSTLRNILDEVTNGEYDSEGRAVVHVQQPEPSLGEPMQLIQVPEEVNANAEFYDNPDIIKVRQNTPRSFSYPIGKERATASESLREPFDPDLTAVQNSPEVMSAHQSRLNAYKQDINDCIGNRQSQLDVEIGMLGYGDRYNNAVYLSQTFEEIEQCYDNIGMAIIDEFYAHNNDVLRDYNRNTAKFHVDSSDVSFDPKYCEENCSMRAIAELQMEKFADFRVYLYKMLAKAPATPVMVDEDIVAPDIDMPEFDDEVYRGRNVNTYRRPAATRPAPVAAARPAPKALRVRTPDGQVKVVRLNRDGEYEPADDENYENIPEAMPVSYATQPRSTARSVTPQATAAAPIRLDYDGVPLIDEDDF